MTGHPPDPPFLFADLAGYTALTEAMGDQDAAALVGDFCESVGALLPEHGAEQQGDRGRS
jgi:class 3 adenylate cyclase